MHLEICSNKGTLCYQGSIFESDQTVTMDFIIEEVRYWLFTVGGYGHVKISGDVPISQCFKLIAMIEEVTGRAVRVVDDDHCE